MKLGPLSSDSVCPMPDTTLLPFDDSQLKIVIGRRCSRNVLQPKYALVYVSSLSMPVAIFGW